MLVRTAAVVTFALLASIARGETLEPQVDLPRDELVSGLEFLTAESKTNYRYQDHRSKYKKKDRCPAPENYLDVLAQDMQQ